MSSTEAKDTKRKRKATGRKKAAGKAAKKTASKAKRKPSTRTKQAAEALVVVESPTKARTLGKYLGRGYAVKATVGHLRDLPTRELGVDVDAGFQPKYVTIKGKAKTLNEIKRAAKKASKVYLATDPDREGEAIAWHVADQLMTEAPIQRVLFHEITQDAVRQAMEDPGVEGDQDGSLGRPGPDSRPSVDRRTRAGHPGVQAARVLVHRCALRQGRRDVRGLPP
jgi:DNA topoisomerase-1